jgi:hypothetical protein
LVKFPVLLNKIDIQEYSIMKAIKVSAWQTTLLVALSLLLPHQVFAQEDWFEKGLIYCY